MEIKNNSGKTETWSLFCKHYDRDGKVIALTYDNGWEQKTISVDALTEIKTRSDLEKADRAWRLRKCLK